MPSIFFMVDFFSSPNVAGVTIEQNSGSLQRIYKCLESENQIYCASFDLAN